MKRLSFNILRVGLAITFIWIGILILKTPEAWGGYLRPWAARLLPIPLAKAMLGTAILDIAIGAMLLINSFVWFAALIGALHILVVLAVSGITDITVRDIAIFAATIALVAESFPKTFTSKIIFRKKQDN